MQTLFFGDILRRKALENMVMTGKIEGRKDRDRPREMILIV